MISTLNDCAHIFNVHVHVHDHVHDYARDVNVNADGHVNVHVHAHALIYVNENNRENVHAIHSVLDGYNAIQRHDRGYVHLDKDAKFYDYVHVHGRASIDVHYAHHYATLS